MKTKMSIILALLAILPSFIFAEKVDITIAKQVAINWYSTRSKQSQSYQRLRKTLPNTFKIQKSFIEAEQSEELIYIFNLTDDGFIIVSADDITIPILGYSLTGQYDSENRPPALVYMLENYKKQILFARKNKLSRSEKAESSWKKLNESSEIYNGNDTYQTQSLADEVLPLITTTWDQGWPYNEMCPADPSGSGGHANAGCVATAMAQIIKYWEHPTQGHGLHSYIPTTHPEYGVQSVNFGTTTYEWANMPNSISESNTSVATLLYHCGVAVDMDYGPGSSAAFSSFIIASLQNYFNYYSSSMDYIAKEQQGFSDLGWENLLKNELDNSRPVYYQCGEGSGPRDSHAFVCDGYQSSNYFHMNWGWSGSYDGYYYLNDLTPGWDDFTGGDRIIIGIQRDDGSVIYKDTVWDADTIKVQSHITVLDDVTLTIAPGTVVEFQGHYKLEIFGTLLAVGTEQDTITFSINDSTGFSNINIEDGGWCGIRFDNGWGYGGVEGLMDDNDSSKITYCRLEYGKADADGGFNNNAIGGAVLVRSFSKLQINHCLIVNNISAHGGGGINIQQEANIQLTHNIICNNMCTGGSGGGVNCTSSNPEIAYNSITNNFADSEGGGIFCQVASPLIINNLINGNTADQSGGGISCENNSNPSLSNNTINNNSASHYGGGLSIVSSSSIITNNTISNNSCFYGGGGIFCGGNPTLINNTIYNNSTIYSHGKGGGIYFESSNAILINSDILNNSTNGEFGGGGGGIYCRYSIPKFINVVVWGNKVHFPYYKDNQVYLEENSSDPFISYCDIQGGMDNFMGDGAGSNYDVSQYQNTIDSEPMFINPSNGAGTEFDGLYTDWSLRDTSPCVNSGIIDTTGLNLPEFDLADNPRIYGGQIDMGAYEYCGPSVFEDVVIVANPGTYHFNAAGEGGDGHVIYMTFTSLSGNGNVTVQQNNQAPSNSPCINVCGFRWEINKEVSITAFSVDIAFHYTDSDVSGYTETSAFLGIAKFNESTNTWQWLGGTVDASNNTITVNGVTSFSTFALFRRIFGDVTGDGYVDAADLQHLGDCWHSTNSGEFTEGSDSRFFNYNKNTDSGNQIIDAADLQVFGDCWHNGVKP